MRFRHIVSINIRNLLAKDENPKKTPNNNDNKSFRRKNRDNKRLTHSYSSIEGLLSDHENDNERVSSNRTNTNAIENPTANPITNLTSKNDLCRLPDSKIVLRNVEDESVFFSSPKYSNSCNPEWNVLTHINSNCPVAMDDSLKKAFASETFILDLYLNDFENGDVEVDVDMDGKVKESWKLYASVKVSLAPENLVSLGRDLAETTAATTIATATTTTTTSTTTTTTTTTLLPVPTGKNKSNGQNMLIILEMMNGKYYYCKMCSLEQPMRFHHRDRNYRISDSFAPAGIGGLGREIGTKNAQNVVVVEELINSNVNVNVNSNSNVNVHSSRTNNDYEGTNNDYEGTNNYYEGNYLSPSKNQRSSYLSSPLHSPMASEETATFSGNSPRIRKGYTLESLYRIRNLELRYGEEEKALNQMNQPIIDQLDSMGDNVLASYDAWNAISVALENDESRLNETKRAISLTQDAVTKMEARLAKRSLDISNPVTSKSAISLKQALIEKNQKSLDSMAAMIRRRRNVLVQECLEIYPIVRTSIGTCSISEIPVPPFNSEAFKDVPIEQMVVAITQIAHLLKQLTIYFNVRIRHPIVLAGNYSRIVRNPIATNNHKINNQNVFSSSSASSSASASAVSSWATNAIHNSLISYDQLTTSQSPKSRSRDIFLRPLEPESFPLYYVLDTEKYEYGLALLSLNFIQMAEMFGTNIQDDRKDILGNLLAWLHREGAKQAILSTNTTTFQDS